MRRAVSISLLAVLACSEPAFAADPSLEDTKRFRWTPDGAGGYCLYFDRDDDKANDANEPCFDGSGFGGGGGAAPASLQDTKRFRWTPDGAGGYCLYFDRDDDKANDANEPCFDGSGFGGGWGPAAASLVDTRRFRWTSDGAGGLCVYFDRNDDKTSDVNEPCFDGGGAAATAPGIIGASATDTTLDYFATLTHAEFLPTTGYTRVYFSSGTTDDATHAGCSAALGGTTGGWPTGDDDGLGTKASPYRSLARLQNVTKAGHIIAEMDACDTWATSGSAGTPGDLECVAGAGCDVEYLVSTPSAGVRDISWGTTDWAGCAGMDDELCWAIVGSDTTGTYRPLIDFTVLTGADQQRYLFRLFNNSTEGWAHFENLRLGTAAQPYPDGCAAEGDIFRPEENGKLSVVHVESYNCAPGAFQNELWTTHWDGSGPTDVNYNWFLNNTTHYVDNAGNENSMPYASAGQAAIGVIGGDLQSTALSGASGSTRICLTLQEGVVGSNISSYAFVYGYDCNILDDTFTTEGGFRCNGSTDNATECYIFVARSKVNTSQGAGTGGGFWRPRSASNYQSVTYRGYRNSSINNVAYIADSQFNTAAELSVVDRCSVHWKGAGAGHTNNFYNNTNTSSTCDGLRFDIDDTGVIESDNSVFKIDNVAFTTVAAAKAAWSTCTATVAPPDWSAIVLPTTLTADPYGGATDGYVTTAEALTACDAGTITEPFRNGFYIPTYLAGTQLTGAILNPSDATDLPLGW